METEYVLRAFGEFVCKSGEINEQHGGILMFLTAIMIATAGYVFLYTKQQLSRVQEARTNGLREVQEARTNGLREVQEAKSDYNAQNPVFAFLVGRFVPTEGFGHKAFVCRVWEGIRSKLAGPPVGLPGWAGADVKDKGRKMDASMVRRAQPHAAS
mgnify:CR=1 FL=1